MLTPHNIQLHNGDNSGFTVLEALVALALLAAAFIPLMGMQSQFVERIAAQKRLETRLSLQAALSAQLEDVNFMQHQTGRLNGAGYSAQWQAVPRGTAVTSRLSTGDPARFDIQAYNITILATYIDGRQEQYRLPGYGWRAKWAINN